MQEAMLKVKMELGNEAVILQTKKRRQKGFWNYFKKPFIELVVAIDDFSAKKTQALKEKEMAKEVKREDEKSLKQTQEPEGSLKAEEKTQKLDATPKMQQLEDKIQNMEGLIQKVLGEMKKLEEGKVAEGVKGDPTRTIVKNLFYNNLIKNDVEPEIAEKIMKEVLGKMGESTNVSQAAGIIYGILASLLGSPQTIQLKEDKKPTVVVFVGPTGVGKTTTLAKIAADYALNQKKKVGLITADTYRIAAVDQLKTYADILGLPVSVIYSASEVKEAIEKFADKDIVLIDTAGRSVKEKEQFDELGKLVEFSTADEVYLVLSSTTSASNCKEILKHYEFLKNYKLIFTKLDETSILGVILNTKVSTNRSLSYLTTGQSVPDDIEIADSQKLTKNLLGSIKK